MKTDNQIQQDVMDELGWEPAIDPAEIGVAVKDGIVTLSGIVDTYAMKLAAEKAAKRVSGVKAVAEDIQVGKSPSYRKSDTEIAEAVLNALKWHTAIKEERIKVKVEDGIVKLEGEVDWDYQRNSAKSAIENLTGVRLVLNLVTVKPRITPTDIQQKIMSAFQRSASLDSSKIHVDVFNSRVTLSGDVRSIAEKDDAERAAWAAPGVTTVNNNLEVHVPEYAF